VAFPAIWKALAERSSFGPTGSPHSRKYLEDNNSVTTSPLYKGIRSSYKITSTIGSGLSNVL
jgi:hypothetical protein